MRKRRRKCRTGPPTRWAPNCCPTGNPLENSFFPPFPGGYYLTSAYGALSLIKNFQEEQAARLLSSEARDTLRQWHKRRTTNRTIPSVDDFQVCGRPAVGTDSCCFLCPWEAELAHGARSSGHPRASLRRTIWWKRDILYNLYKFRN